jgi:hypothetical protein
MTHFLSRLVGRARGTAPQIEPRVASRFAPITPSDIPPTNAPRVPRSRHDRITPPQIEIQPNETESQPPVSPTRTATESDSTERRSQPTPIPPKIELRQPDAATNQSTSIPEESTEAPIKIARETLLVPQFQDAASPLDLGQTTHDATQEKSSAVQVPVSSTSLDDGHTEAAGRPTLQKARPGAFIAAPPLSLFREQARDQPTTQNLQQHLPAPTPDLPSSRERSREKNAGRSLLPKQRPLAPISVSRLSPLALREEIREQAPIVHVTIGRIEVRAAPAPTPTRRKPVSRPAPKLTLDAYLKSRREGAR